MMYGEFKQNLNLGQQTPKRK